MDYRFFIGFKLLLNDQEMSMKSIGKPLVLLSAFIRDVNHQLMGDFVSMPHTEVGRFQKMESFLQNKIARRLRFAL